MPTTTVETGATPKRPYGQTVEANTCKKCSQFPTADTGQISESRQGTYVSQYLEHGPCRGTATGGTSRGLLL